MRQYNRKEREGRKGNADFWARVCGVVLAVGDDRPPARFGVISAKKAWRCARMFWTGDLEIAAP